MSDKIVGIGTRNHAASVFVGEACYGRRRRQIHVRSPKHGYWLVSVTERQAAALEDAFRAIGDGKIALLTEEVTDE